MNHGLNVKFLLTIFKTRSTLKEQRFDVRRASAPRALCGKPFPSSAASGGFLCPGQAVSLIHRSFQDVPGRVVSSYKAVPPLMAGALLSYRVRPIPGKPGCLSTQWPGPLLMDSRGRDAVYSGS